MTDTTFRQNGRPVPPTPDGHYEGNFPYVKVLYSDELLAEMKLRDDDCNALIVDIGEPGPDGFYTPTITVDRTDNPLDRLRVCGTCRDLRNYYEDGMECMLDHGGTCAGMSCHLDPPRWTPYWEVDQ